MKAASLETKNRHLAPAIATAAESRRRGTKFRSGRDNKNTRRRARTLVGEAGAGLRRRTGQGEGELAAEPRPRRRMRPTSECCGRARTAQWQQQRPHLEDRSPPVRVAATSLGLRAREFKNRAGDVCGGGSANQERSRNRVQGEGKVGLQSAVISSCRSEIYMIFFPFYLFTPRVNTMIIDFNKRDARAPRHRRLDTSPLPPFTAPHTPRIVFCG